MENRERIYDDDKDILRERSDSYDSDTSRSGYATSQTSDNEYYDFDNEMNDMDRDDENVEEVLSGDITKKEEDIIDSEEPNTPKIYRQSSALAVEYNIDDMGKLTIPYGIFMECKTIPDGNVVCVKRDLSTTSHIRDNTGDDKIDVKINKKTRKNEKFNKTKKKIRRSNVSRVSKRNNSKMRKGTKRKGVKRH